MPPYILPKEERDRRARNRTTQSGQKGTTEKPQHDQISQQLRDSHAPHQSVSIDGSLPDIGREVTRARVESTGPEGGTDRATATETISKDDTILSNLDYRFNSEDDFFADEATESGESSSDESAVSETGTIISIASSTTTVDIDATEAVFRRLLLFQDLRYLWPQLVLRAGSRKKSVLTIERLLRRYSEDLSNLAASIESLDGLDSGICLKACRFVRRSRLNIAHRIWEAYDGGNEDYPEAEDEVKEPLENNTTVEVPGELEDDNFIYDIAERFLFDTAPIEALQSSVKTLVRSQHPGVEGRGFEFYSSAEVLFSNVLSLIYDPPLEPGYQRIRWQCICGQKLYDDYTELQPGGVLKLEELLKQYFSERHAFKETLDPAAQVKPTSRGGVITGCVNFLSSIWTSNKTSSTLPRHKQSKLPTSKLGACSVIPGNSQGSHNFVLLCVPFMRWVAKLWQAEVCRINSDQDFFRVLRYYYDQHGMRSWARLRKVEAINFVKFELYPSQIVDVQKCPDVPTETQAFNNYTFDPLPAETNPPIGPKLLAHLLEHPEHAEVLPVLYRKFPKKLHAKLQACPQKGNAVGWGIEFVEGLNWFTVFLCGCLGFTAALVSAIIWSVVRNDVQGGFAIAGFMLAFLGFCLGIARTEIQIA